MTPARKGQARRTPFAAGWKRRGPVVAWTLVQLRYGATYRTTLQDSGRPLPREVRRG